MHALAHKSHRLVVGEKLTLQYQREVFKFLADIVMSLGDIFGYISSKTGRIWIKLGRVMGNGEPVILQNFGQDLPEAAEKGKKYEPFSWYLNTTHLFGHFRFTDFRETWQEYVNPCAGES